ncbi:hypothetical protein EHM92_02700, partial [bacterium]
MPKIPMRWGGFTLNGSRPIIIFLALTAASSFWSTAALEIFAILFLLTVLLQGHSRDEQRRVRAFYPETLVQLFFWFLYFIGVLISFFKAPAATAHLPLHMVWHPLLFPAVLLLGLRKGEIRLLAVVFVVSGCISALVTLAMLPASTAEHLESLFVGDTTFFDLLVLAALTGICLAFAGEGRPRLFLLITIPMAAAVMLSSLRAPAIIILGASLLLVLAWRPRAAFVW